MQTTTINLDEITLAMGEHESRDAGVCALEAVAWLAGEEHSDHPACTSPVIGAFVRSWNDCLPTADRNRLLKPLLPRLIGTVGDEARELRRSWMAIDWMIREYAPAWLRLAKLEDAASSLECLAEVDSAERAVAIMPALEVARAKSSAAWDAAGAAVRAAVRAAAGAAVRAAAGAAVRDAVRDAAGAAVRDAVRDAAGAAAWDAVRDAVRDAAWDAAGAAAWDAAGAAAWDAAGAAAWAALSPTVSALQQSALRLVERMIAA